MARDNGAKRPTGTRNSSGSSNKNNPKKGAKQNKVASAGDMKKLVELQAVNAELDERHKVSSKLFNRRDKLAKSLKL